MDVIKQRIGSQLLYLLCIFVDSRDLRALTHDLEQFKPICQL